MILVFFLYMYLNSLYRLLPWPANENHVLVQNVHDFRKCSRVSYMGRLSARFECSHRRGISLFRGILHAVGEGINNEWRRCCAYAYDDYRVLQWKSLAKCPCNGKHRIRFNEAADARSKARSLARQRIFPRSIFSFRCRIFCGWIESILSFFFLPELSFESLVLNFYFMHIISFSLSPYIFGILKLILKIVTV